VILKPTSRCCRTLTRFIRARSCASRRSSPPATAALFRVERVGVRALCME
jgi:hypothetical protein